MLIARYFYCSSMFTWKDLVLNIFLANSPNFKIY